jgi:hypothetical protein
MSIDRYHSCQMELSDASILVTFSNRLDRL